MYPVFITKIVKFVKTSSDRALSGVYGCIHLHKWSGISLFYDYSAHSKYPCPCLCVYIVDILGSYQIIDRSKGYYFLKMTHNRLFETKTSKLDCDAIFRATLQF